MVPDGTMAETVTTSATDFKRHVGKYLDVAGTGAVIIEKQGRPFRPRRGHATAP